MNMDRAQFLATLLAASLAAAGCGSKVKKEESKEKDEDEEDEDDKKKKKKKKKKGGDDDEEDDKKSKKAKETAEPKKADPAPSGGPDLGAILGTKADGFAPLVFAKLKEDMSPEEAGKIFPGGDKPSEFGFAEIKTGLPAGVIQYTLSYQEKKLKFAEIVFPKSISDDAFWARLVAHLKAKLAPVEMTELEPGKKSVMWIGPGFHSITVRQKISMNDEDGYEISYAVI